MSRYFKMGNSKYEVTPQYPSFDNWLFGLGMFLLGICLMIQLYDPNDGIQTCIYLLLGVTMIWFIPVKYIGEDHK